MLSVGQIRLLEELRKAGHPILLSTLTRAEYHSARRLQRHGMVTMGRTTMRYGDNKERSVGCVSIARAGQDALNDALHTRSQPRLDVEGTPVVGSLRRTR